MSALNSCTESRLPGSDFNVVIGPINYAPDEIILQIFFALQTFQSDVLLVSRRFYRLGQVWRAEGENGGKLLVNALKKMKALNCFANKSPHIEWMEKMALAQI